MGQHHDECTLLQPLGWKGDQRGPDFRLDTLTLRANDNGVDHALSAVHEVAELPSARSP